MLSLFAAVGTTHSVLDFDTQPYLLNCQNGTLDLETGRLYKPRRADLLSRLAPVPYESGAHCPVFVRFLVRIMGAIGGVPSAQVRVAGERALFLQKAVGVSLSADVGEKVVFGLFGPKDSGKTTFLEAIRFVLGEYAGQVLIESLLSRSDQSDANAKEDLADLYGKRFVTTSEAERRHRLAGARLKYLTQGAHSQIKSARKYEHTFTFPATHKLWIDSNERPSLSGTDDALWDRFKPVPFQYPVSADERDPNLPDKLRVEAAGILAWAVEGFRRWRKEGLGDPPDVVAARQDWRDECDPLKDFLEECCEVDLADAKLWAVNSDLWKAYEDWARANGERYTLSRTAFGLQLERRGMPQELRRIDGKRARVRQYVRVS
jgi:putative DNA primase/helicase